MKKNYYIKNWILENQDQLNERFLKGLKIRGIYSNVNPLLFLKNMKELRKFLNFSYSQKIKKFNKLKENLKLFSIKKLKNEYEKKENKEMIKGSSDLQPFFLSLQKITFNIINRYYPKKFDFSQMNDIVMSILYDMNTKFEIDLKNYKLIEKIYYSWLNPRDKTKKIPDKINIILENAGLIPKKKSNRWDYINQISFDDPKLKKDWEHRIELSYYSKEYLENEISEDLKRFVINRSKGMNSRNHKDFGYSYRQYRNERDNFKKWEADNYLH